MRQSLRPSPCPQWSCSLCRCSRHPSNSLPISDPPHSPPSSLSSMSMPLPSVSSPMLPPSERQPAWWSPRCAAADADAVADDCATAPTNCSAPDRRSAWNTAPSSVHDAADDRCRPPPIGVDHSRFRQWPHFRRHPNRRASSYDSPQHPCHCRRQSAGAHDDATSGHPTRRNHNAHSCIGRADRKRTHGTAYDRPIVAAGRFRTDSVGIFRLAVLVHSTTMPPGWNNPEAVEMTTMAIRAVCLPPANVLRTFCGCAFRGCGPSGDRWRSCAVTKTSKMPAARRDRRRRNRCHTFDECSAGQYLGWTLRRRLALRFRRRRHHRRRPSRWSHQTLPPPEVSQPRVGRRPSSAPSDNGRPAANDTDWWNSTACTNGVWVSGWAAGWVGAVAIAIAVGWIAIKVPTLAVAMRATTAAVDAKAVLSDWRLRAAASDRCWCFASRRPSGRCRWLRPQMRMCCWCWLALASICREWRDACRRRVYCLFRWIRCWCRFCASIGSGADIRGDEIRYLLG